MNHLSDEQLMVALIDHSEELTAAHLAECDECSLRMQQLTATFSLLDDEVVPERGDDYANAVWQRVGWQLPVRRRAGRWWFAAAASLLLVLLGFLAGRGTRSAEAIAPMTAGSRPAPGVAGPKEASRGAAAVLTATAAQQIERSTRLLVEIANQSETQVTPSRAVAEELLATSRLYRTAAGSRGAGDVAQLLSEIEPILLELAHAPDEMTGDDLAAIQRRIESRDLLFKLRVVATTLRDQEQRTRRSNLTAPQGAASL